MFFLQSADPGPTGATNLSIATVDSWAPIAANQTDVVVLSCAITTTGGPVQVFCYGEKLGWNAEETLAPIKDKSFVGLEMKNFIEAILKEAKSGDHILVMSNGSFDGIHQALLKKLA